MAEVTERLSAALADRYRMCVCSARSAWPALNREPPDDLALGNCSDT
jgi:hypothetical protein